MKQLLLISLMVLTGCANVNPPIDVAIIPNDCANKDAIIRWLESQATLNQPMISNREKYENYRSTIKSRIWNLRYSCQPV
jgi:hypothetical protein